jgi:uncharacterized protein (DUF2062 family)
VFCDNTDAHFRHETADLKREPVTKAETMADLLNLAMLVGASIVSLAFGLFTAYGILRLGFALMRPRRTRVTVETQQEPAGVL